MEDLESMGPNSLDARLTLDRKAVAQAAAAGVLDIDAERCRARYSDGQLLGADGFRLDQRVFERRQRDLGSFVERGVVHGLQLEQAFVLDINGVPTNVLDPTRCTLSAGHGVTSGGHTVVLRESLTIDLTDLAVFQQLDAAFALDTKPRPPARTQSGVFSVVLRPIEFTANPIAPYPTSITGERRIEDGDVIEACLVTLVPLVSESGLDAVAAGPAALARRVFGEGLEGVASDHALPVAVMALERGQIAWVDMHLARREAAADPGHGFGVGARGLLQAHASHFAERMSSIVVQRQSDGVGLRFPATDYFEVLPPAGQIPAEVVEVVGNRVLQWFFPPNVSAELALVPEDEVPVLRGEAMKLGPYVLTASADELEASPLLMVVAVPRAAFADATRALSGVLRQPIAARLGSFARRKPVDALLARGRLPAALLSGGGTSPELQPWQELLTSSTTIFYFKQRRRLRSPFALARFGPMPLEQRPSGTMAQIIRARIAAAGELERFDLLLAAAGADALERLEALLSLPLFGSELLAVNAVVAELAALSRKRLLEPGAQTTGGEVVSIAGVPSGAPASLRVRTLGAEEVEAIARRYAGASPFGSGLTTARTFEPALGDFQNRLVIAQSLRVSELDGRIRSLASSEQEPFATQLLAAAVANDVNAIRDLVGYIRPQPPALPTPVRSNGVPSSGFAAAVGLGQGGLFTLLWNQTDDSGRNVLDSFIQHVNCQQPLVATVLMVGTIRAAWSITLLEPRDIQDLLERLYRWEFSPEQPFTAPTLTTAPAQLLTTAQLTTLANAGSQLAAGGIPAISAASAALEAAGFPSTAMPAGDAYRILGCAYNSIRHVEVTAGVEADLPAEFSAYAAELTAAVVGLDLEQILSVRERWFRRL